MVLAVSALASLGAGAAEWILLARLGDPDPAVLIRALGASVALAVAATAVLFAFLRLSGKRWLAAVASLLFLAGLLALRPPLLSPMSWFERAIRPPPAPVVRNSPRIAMMTDLPLVWGDGGMEALLAGTARSAGAYRLLARAASVRPLDMIAAGDLPGLDLLILAQPRMLDPHELVRIDAWVRNGGRALVFADPALHWASDTRTGERRPPGMSMIAPLTDHWGLEIAAARPGWRIVRETGDGMLFGAGRIIVRDPGMIRAGPGCHVTAEGLIATCRIGRGTAIVVADADLWNDESWVGPGDRGAGRGARMADNPFFILGAAWALMGRDGAVPAGDEVRWAQPDRYESPAFWMSVAAIPCFMALIWLGIARLSRRR